MSSYAWSKFESKSHSVAVLLPGAGYTAQGPLLYWCAEMLSGMGWHVQAVEWTIDDDVGNDPEPFVEQAVTQAFDAAPRASRRLIVAKSFGTHALPWARRKGISGIWLTPILTGEAVRQALLSAPCDDIAVGGEADTFWLPEMIAATKARVISIPKADHSLNIEGDWKKSLAIHSDVLANVAQHLAANSSSAPSPPSY